MGRALLDVLLPFLLPFAGYAAYLVLRRRYPFVLSLLAAGFFGHRGRGDYVPARLENGVLVPGRME